MKIGILQVLVRFFLISLLLISSSSIYATTMRKVELKELVERADDIIIGTCLNKESKFVSRHIETTIKIKTSEVLKGKIKAGDEIEITQMGGEVEKPIPIGQFIPGMPHFRKGEEVLLFLSNKRPKVPEKVRQRRDPKSKIHSSPYVVGLNQGKFTIITDEKSGKKFAVRFTTEKINQIPKDEINEKIERALASQQRMIENGTLKEDNIALKPETVEKLKSNSIKKEKEKEKESDSKSPKNESQKISSKDEKVPVLSIPKGKTQSDNVKELNVLINDIKKYINK